jgi:hypothetical protein
MALLQNPQTNHGTAFTESERAKLKLNGLLPPRVFSIEQQAARVMHQFEQIQRPLDRYSFLMALQVCYSCDSSGVRAAPLRPDVLTTRQGRNETLFYRVVTDHLAEMMPFICERTCGPARINFRL